MGALPDHQSYGGEALFRAPQQARKLSPYRKGNSLMAQKGRRKQIAHRKFCRDQVAKGLINQADGTWRPSQGKALDLHMIAGYRFGAAAKRRRKVTQEVE